MKLISDMARKVHMVPLILFQALRVMICNIDRLELNLIRILRMWELMKTRTTNLTSIHNRPTVLITISKVPIQVSKVTVHLLLHMEASNTLMLNSKTKSASRSNLFQKTKKPIKSKTKKRTKKTHSNKIVVSLKITTMTSHKSPNVNNLPLLTSFQLTIDAFNWY
jgi:hypothetical protein